MKPEECPLCWRFDCQCWRTAIAMEARQGGDAQQAPSRSDDSAGRNGIAQNIS